MCSNGKESSKSAAAPRPTIIFNLSFTRVIVPQLWKQANISPVNKDGDTGSVTNYRGSSFLSVVGKCQERIIIHSAIYDQVFQYLHDSHHGFLRGRSTVSQLVLYTMMITDEGTPWSQ